MANPVMGNGQWQRSLLRGLGVWQLPLLARRGAAWLVEVALVGGTAVVPWGLGQAIDQQYTGQRVPLNPVLQTTETTIARTLALPLRDRDRQVAPLTNLLWCGALALPLAMVGFQTYLSIRTGKTTAKHWFHLQVIAQDGLPPTLSQVLLRETSRWLIPMGTAYALWHLTGAVPSLGVLAGMGSVLVVAEGAIALTNRQHRSLHDWLARTTVLDRQPRVDARPRSPRHLNQELIGVSPAEMDNPLSPYPFTPTYPHDYDSTGQLGQFKGTYGNEANPTDPANYRLVQPRLTIEPDPTVTTIVWIPNAVAAPSALWDWMRRRPFLTIGLVSAAAIAALSGLVVGTQFYLQSQANRQTASQRYDQKFLTLLNQSTAPKTLDERRGAILALGTLNKPDALQLLADLLSQEENPVLLDAIQQALVSAGPNALPYLQRLNQSLRNDWEAMRFPSEPRLQQQVAQRLQATQRAIAKILTLYSGQLHGVDLRRVHLSRNASNAAEFTLVLSQLDLAGIQLRGAILAHGNLEGSQFYGAGADGRFGTYDDAIADLREANLRDANLSRTNFSHALFNQANLSQASLTQADLSAADLTSSNLSSARLVGTNLSQSQLENASLTGADLAQANLLNANLSGARLGQVSAIGAQFNQANLSRTDWNGADLTEANFTQANLQAANLMGTRLQKANLQSAQLQNANLRGANLSQANLLGANLTGADFAGATLVESSPGTANQFIQRTSDASRALKVEGVDFSAVQHLDPQQLAYICAAGGLHPQCR